jgi:hypothetical protein
VAGGRLSGAWNNARSVNGGVFAAILRRSGIFEATDLP